MWLQASPDPSSNEEVKVGSLTTNAQQKEGECESLFKSDTKAPTRNSFADILRLDLEQHSAKNYFEEIDTGSGVMAT